MVTLTPAAFDQWRVIPPKGEGVTLSLREFTVTPQAIWTYGLDGGSRPYAAGPPEVRYTFKGALVGDGGYINLLNGLVGSPLLLLGSLGNADVLETCPALGHNVELSFGGQTYDLLYYTLDAYATGPAKSLRGLDYWLPVLLASRDPGDFLACADWAQEQGRDDDASSLREISSHLAP